MIDARNGAISIPGAGSVGPTATEDEFSRSEVGSASRLTTESGSDRSYRIDSETMVVRAYFRDGRLWMATLMHRLPNEGGWSTWSEDEEHERKRLHDDLLLKTLGPPPYLYSWGKVESVYDAKDGSSSIVVTYS